MKKKEFKKLVSDMLANLGDTPEAIAKYYESMGIKGTGTTQKQCVTTSYLNAVMASDPTIQDIKVGYEKIQITREGWMFPIKIELSSALKHFITAYDDYTYPQLIESPAQRPVDELKKEYEKALNG